MVMGAEMMNTAVEAAVDMHAQGYDSLAKIAKDVAAGAVLVCAVGAAAVGCVMFFSPFSLGRIAAVFSSGPLPACLLAASVPAAALFIRRRRR
jgi:diacylglycerol kinase (ATP)